MEAWPSVSPTRGEPLESTHGGGWVKWRLTPMMSTSADRTIASATARAATRGVVETSMAQIIANIRTRSTLPQYANQSYEGILVETDGVTFSDLESGGRRFRYSHSQPTVSATGERREWLVYEDCGPIQRLSLVTPANAGQQRPIGGALRVGVAA